MKIALIADTFPPLRTSGAVQLRDLSREFTRQGHELTVLLPNPDMTTPFALDRFEDAEILWLKSPRIKNVSRIKRAFGEWVMPYAMWRNLAKSPLAREKWDGVVWYSPSIFHAPLAKSLMRESNCKGYLIIRDIFPEWAVDLGLMRRGIVYRFFKSIARHQYNTADIIGVQTAGNLGYFDEWGKKWPQKRLEVLENWLGAPATTQCRIRVDQTALAGKKVFVYAGNMGVAQGMDIMIDLADSMKDRADIGFLFVGRGTEAKRLRQLAARRELDNVVFQDEIDPDEIPDLYAQCYAGLIALDPRHRSHNIPGKFLTYMQSHLPVLANVNAGNDLAELVRGNGVGEVCETHQVADLQTACLDLISRIETDADIANRCGQVFQNRFSVNQAVKQIAASL